MGKVLVIMRMGTVREERIKKTDNCHYIVNKEETVAWVGRV